MRKNKNTFNYCDKCTQKIYTLNCFICNTYKLKEVILKLQNEITKLDNENLSNYCIFIESRYFNIITDLIDFKSIKVYKRDLVYFTNQNNIVAIIYNNTIWEDIYNGNDLFTITY